MSHAQVLSDSTKSRHIFPNQEVVPSSDSVGTGVMCTDSVEALHQTVATVDGGLIDHEAASSSEAAATASMSSSVLFQFQVNLNVEKIGWGSKGLDFSSGWNWTPKKNGWLDNSTISGSMPSLENAENVMPFLSRVS